MTLSGPRFQGSRLREAREVRGMTATTLAELVDVTPGAISHYENNRHAPPHRTMEQLADKLGVPTSFFLKPPREPLERVLYWRSRHAATKLQRARSYRRHLWLLDIVDYLRGFIEFPDVDLPDLAIANPFSLTMEEIDEVSLFVRDALSLGDGPIGDLVAMLEKCGAIVTRAHIGADQLDTFSEWRKEDSRPYITLSADKQSDARSRMDAAHELGHMILHRHMSLRDFNKPAVHSLMENQVKRFAGAFLLPAASFEDDLYSHTLDTFRDLKERWRVSIAGMIYRATDLEIIDKDEARKLWIAMSRRKWRKREPGDDDTPPEEPKLLRQAFDMVLDHGMVDARRIEVDLARRIRDIESVAGLPDRYLQNEGGGPLKFRVG